MSASLRCRLCRRPVFAATLEELGDAPAHPCCVFWIEQQGHPYCKACASSKAANREWRRREELRREEAAKQARIERRRQAQATRHSRPVRPLAVPPPPPSRRRPPLPPSRSAR